MCVCVYLGGEKPRWRDGGMEGGIGIDGSVSISFVSSILSISFMRGYDREIIIRKCVCSE